MSEHEYQPDQIQVMSNNEVPRAVHGSVRAIFIMSTLTSKNFRTDALRRGSMRNIHTHPYSAFSVDGVAAVSRMWSLLVRLIRGERTKDSVVIFPHTSY
jgi:hypothetical protein